MLPEYFAIIGAIVASIGGLIYLYATIRGTVRPNRVSWLLWGIFPMLAFVAQRAQGAHWLSWVSFIAGALALLTVAASFFNKNAYWKTELIDYICMLFALCGIVLWAVTKNPNAAILFSILADFSAGFPTLRKALMHPDTENWSAYGLSAIGYILSILAIQTWTFENYAFVVYLAAMNGALALLAFRGNAIKKLKDNELKQAKE